DRLAELEPVHAREHVVDDQQIDRRVVRQCFVRAAARDDLMALALQHPRHEQPDCPLVVDDHDGGQDATEYRLAGWFLRRTRRRRRLSWCWADCSRALPAIACSAWCLGCTDSFSA